MKDGIALVWFRQDLRLADNPALHAAHLDGLKILPLYILDEDPQMRWKMGGASRWWLHQSLESLARSLNGNLCLAKGEVRAVFAELIQTLKIEKIYWNRCYEPEVIKRDTEIKQRLMKQGIEVKSFNGSVLFEPHQVLKEDQTPYKVFTPYYKKGCLTRAKAPREPISEPQKLNLYAHRMHTLTELNLLPKVRWTEVMENEWQPGEEGAKNRLDSFLQQGIFDYKEGRNYPNQKKVSRLSPHLHFGEISPNQVWYATLSLNHPELEEKDREHFLSELAWREFSHYLLYHFPTLPKANLQSKFDDFPWRRDKPALKAWQSGKTGFPIIDAAMRELWQTGYMHNRTRMIVGSFLVKNLLIHWHHGEKWFWDTLVDADLANNSASWQWVAGSGADAAPYFRIFNPITQSQKFDPEGAYIKKYLPELNNLDSKHIHTPWLAPQSALEKAGIVLGVNYPKPIIDLAFTRERALEAFASISKQQS